GKRGPASSPTAPAPRHRSRASTSAARPVRPSSAPPPQREGRVSSASPVRRASRRRSPLPCWSKASRARAKARAGASPPRSPSNSSRRSSRSRQGGNPFGVLGVSTLHTPMSQSTVFNGRYELHRRLARGGMADVFLARDQLLDRPVAVKVLFPEFATDPSFVERFRREAQSAANLDHPNLPSVAGLGQEAGTYFIVIEYVGGRRPANLLLSPGPWQPPR